MASQQASPTVKFEASPAESFMSLPGDSYPSLFDPTTPPSTMNPADVFTPQSTPAKSEEPENGTPSPEEKEETGKKPGKKRKSWGQVLPEPKTNLPPRKRAKTDDEKEQRRVERVLRNRRAAQSSRERKRLEVEALEIRNKELEAMLVNAQKANLILVEELNRFRRDSGVVTRSPSPLNSLRDTPLALSQELFCSQDGHNTSSDSAVNLVDQLISSTANPTVNPASLSPELTPVPDEPKIDPQVKESQSSEENSATSPDLTQHPAEMFLGDSFSMSAAIDADRYILESGLLASPNTSITDDDYLAGDSGAGLSSQSHFNLFNIDDFLNDEANNVVSDIMAASDYAAADHGLELKVHDSGIQIS
ncbi:hypothetical protein EsHS_00005551 [Epichloe bromicola]